MLFGCPSYIQASVAQPCSVPPLASQGELSEEQYRAEPSQAEGTPPASDVLMSAAATEATELPGVEKVALPCPPLDHVGSHRLAVGETGYINDHIALHCIRCPAQVPAPGSVSLHLYSPPIRRVRLYETEENRVVTRRPGFWSIRGKRT